MKLPIIIYNLDNKALEQSLTLRSNTLYFYSYQEISVEVLTQPTSALLYSVVNNNNVLETSSGLVLNNNFGYTLHIPDDNTLVAIKVSTLTEEKTYFIKTRFNNVISEERGNLHYNDILVNKQLPTYEQLIACIPEEFDTSDLIKRLLLDFDSILKHKGTIRSIQQFFDFIGYNIVDVLRLYRDATTNELTQNPNTQKDTASGEYSVLYDNFTVNGLDEDNMPLVTLNIENLELFQETLINAIHLANVYFTSPEQEIIFFGLVYSTNIKQYSSITSDMNMCFELDVCKVRKDFEVNILTQEEVQDLSCVRKKLQIVSQLNVSEKRCYSVSLETKQTSRIFTIDEEIKDSDVFTGDITKTESFFGQILHIEIVAPNLYVEYSVRDLNDPLMRVNVEKQFVTSTQYNIESKFAILGLTTFRVEVRTFDLNNNYDTYFYDFTLSVDGSRVDFEILDSTKLIPNDLTVEIDAPSRILVPVNLKNYVLENDLVPQDLAEYYNFTDISQFTQWVSDPSRYNMIGINQNFPVSKITETIPDKLTDNWLEVLTFKYLPGYELRYRMYGTNTIPLTELASFDQELDKLFVTLVDIYETNNGDETEIFTDTILCDGLVSEFNIAAHKLPVNNFMLFKNGEVLWPTEYELNSPADGSFTITDLEDGDILLYLFSYPINTLPYFFLTTQEGGIEFIPQLHDLVLVNELDSADIISIYDLPELVKNKIPLNYDFPLFPIGSETVDYPTFSSDNPDIVKITIDNIEYPLVESLFPKLISLSNDLADEAEHLKLGDVFVCRIIEKYIVGALDIEWSLYNNFTKALMFQTTDYVLKYRIQENTCYDVELKFTIDSQQYIIRKNSCITSYHSNSF